MSRAANIDDLFGHVPQKAELAIDRPTYRPDEMIPDHIDADLGMVPRVHTKESIRRRMLAILTKARNAQTMPFTPRQLQSHTGLYPIMAEWLEEDGEGLKLLAEFKTEIARLRATEK